MLGRRRAMLVDVASNTLSVLVGIAALASILWLLASVIRSLPAALQKGSAPAYSPEREARFGLKSVRRLAPTFILFALRSIWYLFAVVYLGTALVSLTSVIIHGDISLGSLAHALLLDELWAILVQYPVLAIPATVVGCLLVLGGYYASNVLSKRSVQKHARAILAERQQMKGGE
jgi:hypothetical protein